MTTLVILCTVGGACVGLLNGMLGMGGSFIIIPLLDQVLLRLGLPQSISHIMAVGSAPATILFTCVASFFAHRSHGAVRMDILRRMGAGIFAGSLAGAFLVPHAPILFLKLLFAAVLFIMGLHMLFPRKILDSDQERLTLLEFAGIFFGLLASMTGLAGTLLCLTYLNWRGIPWRQAVGTSSGIGLIVTITSAAGFILSGWSDANLPRYSLGYLYLIVPSMLMARVGAFLVNWKKMPLTPMKKAVALINLGMAVYVVMQACSSASN